MAMNNSSPRISIVTPSFNQGEFIEETILSVINQDYPNIEYIIIDGGSKDNTIEIIKRYEDKLAYWVSEKDNGQSDALNKGFAKATGDICCVINSDDCFYPGAFKLVAEMFGKSNCKWLATSTVVSERMEKHSKIWPPNVATFEFFVNQQTFPQQGVFWSADAAPKPYFDSSFFYAMDHDLFCKIYHKHGAPETSHFLTSFFRMQANSKTSLYEERLINDMTRTRMTYLAMVDEGTKTKIEREFIKLEAVKGLQARLSRREPISPGEAWKLIWNTPYKFRDRQFFSLLFRALISPGR